MTNLNLILKWQKSWIWVAFTSSSITGFTTITLFKGTQACEEETVSPSQFILEECSQSILLK